MEKTKIEYCESTWSPITGCYHDCPYCYARRTANRFKGFDGNPDGISNDRIITLDERLKVTSKDGATRNAAYPYGFVPTFHKYRLNDLKTKKFGKTIFVGSMSDIFGAWVPDEWIAKIFKACLDAPDHRYLFLTKNPARYIKLHDKGLLPKEDNFWFGSTVDTPDKFAFWSDLHHTFLSCEPIMEKFPDFTDSLDMADRHEWIILGAETGNRKDKVIPEKEWITGVVEAFQSKNKAVFMKDSMKPIWGEDILTQMPWRD